MDLLTSSSTSIPSTDTPKITTSSQQMNSKIHLSSQNLLTNEGIDNDNNDEIKNNDVQVSENLSSNSPIGLDRVEVVEKTVEAGKADDP